MNYPASAAPLLGALLMLGPHAALAAPMLAAARSEDHVARGNRTVMCIHARANSKVPRYSIWNGTSWGPSLTMGWSAPGNILTVVGRPCPTRNEIFFACADDQKDVCIGIYNGSTWGSQIKILDDVAREKDRPFDVAYESVSGRAMIAYWNDTVGHWAYRFWDGATLSAESLMPGSGTNHSHFLALVPQPGSNRILCVCNDHNFDTGLLRVLARVWDGSSWSPWVELTANMEKFNRECLAGAWESQSERALVVYSEKNQTMPRYRLWSGAAWSAAMTVPTIGQPGLWYRLASDPNSDQIHMAVTDSSNNLEFNTWNGTAWGTNQQFVVSTGADTERRFDIHFEPGAERAVLMYRNSSKTLPVFRTGQGTSWSSESNGPAIARSLQYFQVAPGFTNGELFLAATDSTGGLSAFRWHGGVLSANTVIETNLPTTAQEPACIVGNANWRQPPRIIRWIETEPD